MLRCKEGEEKGRRKDESLRLNFIFRLKFVLMAKKFQIFSNLK